MDSKVTDRALLLALATLAAPTAWGVQGVDLTPATPGPLIGAGAPALVGLGIVYRRFRQRRIRRSQQTKD